MGNEPFTFLVGGNAGEGVKKAGSAASSLFTGMGRRTFQMDDYQSLIRGDYNFSVISTSSQEITSHYMKADLVVCFDAKNYDMHKSHVNKDGIKVYNSDVVKNSEGIGIPMTSEAKKYPNPNLRLGVSAIAVLSAAIDVSKEQMIDCP